MTNKDNMKQPVGILTLRAYDAQGGELWRSTSRNHIVATGYAAAAEALAGVAGARIAQVGAGTSGNEPTDNDTQIADAVRVDVQSIEYLTPSTVRFNFTFGYDDAVGMTIREFGLYTADGRLFSRKVREPIEKTQYMSLVGAWDIHF